MLAAGEPQVLWRGGQVYIARVHGSRAVGALLVPPGDATVALGMSAAATFENLRLEPIPTPTLAAARTRPGCGCLPSQLISGTS
ncbi:hypothetical protein I545_6515 [Mycobacterium kansasii 662]|uniref:Uncharacterized protein n=1 Tax=Mycobacterium kansasii 662 TaxID=1299326 RepID=X7YFP1_MYCKA|nr:hypothetical protein I545_6515 [Mycobacterium kansasii 662]